jgi:D-alanyl-D-alanine carboxypeptidase (penicillin-binding protein 5/6)
MSPTSNPELRDLVSRIEGTRKRREFFRIAGGALVVVLVLGVAVAFVPKLAPHQVAEAPAPEAPVPSAYDGIALTGKAAIVYDLTDGKVLYARNADAQLPLASLTKLLTIYAALNALGPGARVTITPQAIATEGESGFSVGDQFAFNDLARATLVGSSNDGAEAITEAAEGARAESAQMLLGSAAAAAGMASTYALNGSGLDLNTETSGGYGSAQDIALLAGEIISRARNIARATTEPSVTVQSLAGNTYTFKNTNPDVANIPGLMLSKTGFTDLAGGNLAVVFDASINHPIAVVVLGSTENGRFTDVEKLVRATLTSYVSLPAL